MKLLLFLYCYTSKHSSVMDFGEKVTHHWNCIYLSLNQFQCISGVDLRHLSLVLPLFCFHYPKWLNEEKIVQRLIGMIHPSKDDNVSSSYNYGGTCLYILVCSVGHAVGLRSSDR